MHKELLALSWERIRVKAHQLTRHQVVAEDPILAHLAFDLLLSEMQAYHDIYKHGLVPSGGAGVSPALSPSLSFIAKPLSSEEDITC